ncbi:MAG: DUF445 family protein [Halanaerobium sp.]
MALDLLAIISAAGTGAVTGYLTNNLALKMIFKEYGPLGGVVIKTKDEFIDSISALVERDLINHHTLEEEFSRPEFKAHFTKTVSDFLNNYLVERTARTKLGEIPAWEENFELLNSFGPAAAVDILSSSSDKLKEEKLDLLIPESAQQKFLQNMYTKIIKEAEAEASIEKLILNFYGQLKTKSLAQLLNKESKEQLKNFIQQAIKYFRNNYQELEDLERNDFKESLKELFNLENLSQNIVGEIKEIKIKEFFQQENELKKIVKGADFHDSLKEILVNFKIEIDNSELTLNELFTEEIKADLEQEAAELIYTAESDLIKFLEKEEEQLNNLILKAVEAEIEASTGFKAMSRQGIYNKYQENIDEYGLPLSHLKDHLKEKLKSDNQELAAAVIEKLEKIKVKKIIKEIELEKLTANIEKIVWDFYQQNKDKRLIDLFAEEIFAKDKLTEKIIDLFFKSITKITAEAESVDILIDYFLEFKLADLMSSEKIVLIKDKMAEQIYKFLAEKDFLTVLGVDYLNQNFFSLINKEINSSKPELEAEGKKYLNNLQTELAKKEITSFYNLVKNDPETVVDLTESIMSFFYNNLPQLLEGKVAEAASSNLHQLSDEEVQKAIEDFMGAELKPITYLGALLGAAAGIIFSLSGAETALFSISPLWVDYLTSALLYGGVGWLTNVLALWMIFHPYQQKNILGAQVPFTPGVVAKNRSRFADSMGKFVEKELLKANSAAEIIEESRLEIKNSTLEYFKNNDYQQLFELLSEKNNFLAESALEKINKLIGSSDLAKFKTLIEPVNQELNRLLAEQAESFDFAAEIKGYLAEEEIQLKDLNSLVNSKLSVEQITEAAAGEYRIELSSKELKKIFQNKELYPLFKFLAPHLFEKEIDFDLKNYILELLKDNSDYYLDQTLELLLKQQDQIARLINFKKDEIIEREKEKKGGLLKNTLISGAIYMADLDEFIDSVVERVFQQLQEEYFRENRDRLELLYNNLLKKIENSELSGASNLKSNEILKGFLSSEVGSELLTEVLYLSEDSLAELINSTFKADSKNLFALNVNIKAEVLEYLINQQLSLEQKLQLLLSLKKLFEADNIKKEILKLTKEIDFQALNQELAFLFKKKQLVKIEDLDSEIFADLKTNLVSLLEKEEIKEQLLTESADKISDLSELFEKESDRKSLEYLLSLFIEAGVDSFKANSEELLNSLELKELTAAEVRKMNPAEIEKIFDSFAGRYFAHLKQYGWFGGIFGVLQLLLRTMI